MMGFQQGQAFAINRLLHGTGKLIKLESVRQELPRRRCEGAHRRTNHNVEKTSNALTLQIRQDRECPQAIRLLVDVAGKDQLVGVGLL